MLPKEIAMTDRGIGHKSAATLRRWRKAAGLTQSAAAALIGVENVTVSRWELGKVKSISSENVAGIARVYGRSVEEVMALLGVTDHDGLLDIHPAKKPAARPATVQKASAAEVDDLMSEVRQRGHRYNQRRTNGADAGELQRLLRDLETAARNYVEASFGPNRPIDDMVATLIAFCTAESHPIAPSHEVPQPAQRSATRKP